MCIQRKSWKNEILSSYSLSLLFCGLLFFIFSPSILIADPLDLDHDGILNTDDNCPNVGNPLQYDIDGDNIGLVCDNIDDADNDGVADGDDNCPNDPNPLQYDIDGDGIGVVCDVVENDSDNDGIADADDNCPNDPNPRQYDLDGDGIGIICDNVDDPDSDGLANSEDNCPNDANPKQYDLDGDGIGLVCDTANDSDSDGIADGDDNCPNDANPRQYDLDGDGIGLVCDAETVSDQTAIDRALASEERAQKERDRALFSEARAQSERNRAIYSETQAQAAKDRALSFEQGAQSSRDRKIQFERRAMGKIIAGRNGSGPQFGCSGCHIESQNGRRIITGDNGDFTNNSHHVRGDVEAIDCLSCHYTGDHKSGIVKLVDPDQWTDVIYEYDPANPESVEPFCLGCHDSNGMLAGFGPQPLTDMVVVPNITGNPGSLWENSAHNSINFAQNGAQPITCLGDGAVTGCHGNAHGTANDKILAADAGTSLDQFCFNCHTDGKITNMAISGAVDDIEQAFSSANKHNVGNSFTVNGKTFTLQCTSCHNPHVVTGKHWNVENHVSPITRPDFTADPATNPHAMGTTLWGAVAGQKMDDFASQGSGSGGWYFSVARGRSIILDQPSVYQPPKTSSEQTFEFDGDVLPDYTSLCLDCHTYRMSAANPPVNWGQAGVSCTDNSVDPPDQRIECGAKHGFGNAAKPTYMDVNSTFYGNSGNPDPIFSEPYVQRGRGAGHFMRWPYDSADRNTGVNFVMSCTDCHEAHGSGVSSMLRESVNTGPGTNIWNNMCNNCHYYYGGHHAGMSCGTASCHEANSIHRIIHTTQSNGTYLWTEPSHPNTTSEIASAISIVNSNELHITFTEGVYTNSDQTGALLAKDFVLVDANSDNNKTITGINHVPGEATATITVSSAFTTQDLGADTLATAGMSIWNDSGQPAGPWPVTITAPPTFEIQSVRYGRDQLKLNGTVDDSDTIYIMFTAGAYSSTGGNLQVGDFILDCNSRTITAVSHTAGDDFAVLTLSSVVNQSEIGVCTAAANNGAIFDSYGSQAGTTPIAFTLPPEASVSDMVLRWDFDEGSGTQTNNDGALGTVENLYGILARNINWIPSTKPGATSGDNAVSMDRVSDKGAVQLNYPVNPDDGFPPATYSTGGTHVIVQEMQQINEFSFSVWIKPTALGCQEGKDLGLNSKLRRDILTTQFWIKNWGIGIMRFSDDGDPINGNCVDEDATHDVLRFWVAVGDPNDLRCDAWGGSWPEYVHPVSPAGYTQGSTLMPTDQATCDTSAYPTLPTNIQAHSFAQTATAASGATVALQPGVWQHVVGTWDGRYIRIYIDSQLAAETDMGGTGDYIMVADPHLWGGPGVDRHVSSFFAVGARPIWSYTYSPDTNAGLDYWNGTGAQTSYDINSFTFVGELDDVKYWRIALPADTIQN